MEWNLSECVHFYIVPVGAAVYSYSGPVTCTCFGAIFIHCKYTNSYWCYLYNPFHIKLSQPYQIANNCLMADDLDTLVTIFGHVGALATSYMFGLLPVH